jgi:hypothetical protein
MKATKGGTFKPVALPEPQTAIALCYSVIDLGTLPNIFNGKVNHEHPTVRKLRVTWEFPTLLATFSEDKGLEPFVIGVEVTASTGDKSNLAKLIAQWRNKPLTPVEQEGFDVSAMIGKPAYISFNHKRKRDYIGKEVSAVTNENTVLNLSSIMPKPKEIETPKNRNPWMNWDWDEVEKLGFEACKEKFEKLPKWIQKRTAESKEFKQYAGGYKIEGVEEQNTPDVPADLPKKTVPGDDW